MARAAGSKSSSFRGPARPVVRCCAASAMGQLWPFAAALCKDTKEPVRKDRSERKGGFLVMSGAIAILAFHQVYQPLGGSIVLSAIVAGIPLYVLFVMLAVFRLPAWLSAVTAMLSAAVLAALVWGMPLGLGLSATTEGMANGLWPIRWIVLNAVFFHNLTIASGDFDVIRRSLTRLTGDRRVQALLVAFCFGALMEGIAGFGAPVAISAAILASLGFEPISAAVLALLANTAPVAFGSIGIPIVTLGLLTAPLIGNSRSDQTQVTLALSAMVGRQLPIFSIIIPGFLIVVLAGWNRMVEVLPAVLTAGVAFAVVQFLVSNFIGPELTDVLSALVSMAAVALLLRVWKPKTLWGFAADGAAAPGAVPRFRSVGAAVAQVADPPTRIVRAYMMYVVLVVVILIGQMGNLPFFSGRPPGNVKNALHTPANITADLKCGHPEAPYLAGTTDRQKVHPLSRHVHLGLPGRRRQPGAVRVDHCLHPDGDPRSTAAPVLCDLWTDGAPAGAPHHDDRVHSRHRGRDELLGHDVHACVADGENRRDLPLLLGGHRCAVRLLDGQRHGVEHALRPNAGLHRPANHGRRAPSQSHPHGRYQLVRRCDGQDDQPAKPLGGRGRRQPGGF